MLSLLLLLACQTINDDPAPIDPPPPRVEPAGVVITFDSPDALAVAAKAANEERPFLTGYTANWCSNCKTQKAQLPDIVWEDRSDWNSETIPPETGGLMPAYQRADGQWWSWKGKTRFDREELLAWARQAKPVVSSQPITGSISNLDKYLEPLKYVSNISGTFSEESIDLGSVTVALNRADWQLLVDNSRSISLRFQSRKPSARWGLISMQVNGATLKGDTLTVDVPGPDWQLKVGK